MSQLEKEIKEKNTTIQNMKLNLESSQKRGKTNNDLIIKNEIEDVPVGTYRSNGSANGSIVFKRKRSGLYYESSGKNRVYITRRAESCIEFFSD
ncbi:hypothetical protein BpHYR1_026303 [Brachionus plicatilis]|uniref:Uncharacterized protein n=1 Tax=Brachionus plicatilis TaxID=10195 RepID=A0A3M7PE70_BRAPC|nr:hypothetical protein BpHYR1_026303 [Brachionus plicatilis]